MDFNLMLDEAYDLLYKNPINKLIIPIINIDKTPTRLHWTNVSALLNVINRSSQHLLQYLKYELSNKEINWVSDNIDLGLFIYGKNIKKEFLTELVLKYVNNCVICSSCKSYDTILTKFNSKKYNFECNNCKMTKVI